MNVHQYRKSVLLQERVLYYCHNTFYDYIQLPFTVLLMVCQHTRSRKHRYSKHVTQAYCKSA